MNNSMQTNEKAAPLHIGDKIAELLEARHMTKRELGERIGVSASNAVHLTTRNSVDVRLLQRVGNALKYDFFKHHFPIDDGTDTEFELLMELRQQVSEKDKKIEELNQKIAEMQKQMEETEPLRNEMRMLKFENEHLREFNEFVKAAVRPMGMRLRSGQARRKSLGDGGEVDDWGGTAE